MNISVVIATYNERENIQSLVPKVLRLRDDIRVLIVDDSSPDGTGEMAEELARRTGRVKVIHRNKKKGLGSALRIGLKEALRSEAELAATMDADHSHAPEHLPQMIELATKYDIVVGSRYVSGGGVVNWGMRRVLLSKTANFYARTISGLRVKDCTSNYRVYSAKFLSSLNFERIYSDGYSFLVEVLILAERGGFSVHEFPIVFKDRVEGRSKINFSEIAGGAWNLLKHRIKNLRK